MNWNKRAGAGLALFCVLGLVGFGVVSISFAQAPVGDQTATEAELRNAGCEPEDWGCLYYPPIAREFDTAYRASLRPVVRDAMAIQDQGERASVLRGLAEVGAVIDHAIMVDRQSPFFIMRGRVTGGYTWVPSALQAPIPVVPGISFPGLPSYDPDNPPAGSIEVIDPLDRAQWPEPFEKPAPAPAPDGKLVGVKNGPMWVSTALGRARPAGARITEDGRECVKQILFGLFGAQHFWICAE